jgi:hypothetical protein
VGRLARPVLFTLAPLVAAIPDIPRVRKPLHARIARPARMRRAPAAAVLAQAVDGGRPKAGIW